MCSSASDMVPFKPATHCAVYCTSWDRPHDRVGRKCVLRSMWPGLPSLLARRHRVGVGATPRRCHAVVAVGLDRSAGGTGAARASNRRPSNGAAFTDGAARVDASRSRTSGTRPCRCLSLMLMVVYGRPETRSTGRHESPLYNARRIMYGVRGGDATRVRPAAIAMTRGTPGAGGVLAALGRGLATRRVCPALRSIGAMPERGLQTI